MVRVRQVMRTPVLHESRVGSLRLARELLDNDSPAESPSVSKLKDPSLPPPRSEVTITLTCFGLGWEVLYMQKQYWKLRN